MEETRIPFKLYKKAPKTPQDKYGFVPVDLNAIKVNSPIILCLGGSGIVGKEGANGMARFVLNCLNTEPNTNDLTIYSLVYGSDDEAPMDGTLTHEEVHMLADKIFMPLVSKDGKKIDVLTAQKNMRNINIVSHCFGMAVANILSVTVADNMQNLGYKNSEITKILRQVTNISYAPLKARILPFFSVIDFYSMQDQYSKHYEPLFEKCPKDQFAVTNYNENENHLSLITNSIIGKIEDLNIFDEHSVGILKRTNDWQYYPQANFKEEFTLKERIVMLKKAKTVDNLFSRADMLSKCFSLCIATAASNSLNNMGSSKLQPLNLVETKSNIDYLLNEQNIKEQKAIISEIKNKKTKSKKPQNVEF